MPGFKTISPIDGATVFEAAYHQPSDVEQKLASASSAERIWASTPLEDRIALLEGAVAWLVAEADRLGKETTRQMGRPIRFSPKELTSGLAERSRHMLAIAPNALSPLEPKHDRLILKRPLGTVAVLAPWNYPFLTAVNAIIPALAAGNCVILKHAEQTPLTAIAFQQAFDRAGLPDGVFQHVFLDHAGVAHMIADPRIDYVAFTGSVAGGRAIVGALTDRFTDIGLELGGKDAAYVRDDVDLDHAIATIADGGFFNSGQSCCGVERVYVARARHDALVEGLVAEARKLTLGDPLSQSTTLGPMARARGADNVRDQIDAAVAVGAKAQLGDQGDKGSPYLPPEILTNVDHSMAVMREETFGPVLAIMPVDSDAEAIALMNDSAYGLTASIWTADADRAFEIGHQLDTGTVFLNRCDYLDPALAWTGVKDSGRGISLSALAYDRLTRPQSFNFG